MCVLQRWLFRSFRWIVTSIKSIFSFSSKLWELDGWPEARQRGHRGGLGASEQSGATQIPFFCITLFWQPPPTYGGYQKQNSGSWCGQWERSSRRYTNNNQHGQAGAESLPTIQEHISEAPTAAGIERQQQAGLQPEQPEHPQLSKSRRGEKTNPGVDCEPRSSAGQGSDNSSTTAWHVLSVPSLLWPTLSGSLALLCTTTVFIHFWFFSVSFPICCPVSVHSRYPFILDDHSHCHLLSFASIHAANASKSSLSLPGFHVHPCSTSPTVHPPICHGWSVFSLVFVSMNLPS